MTPEDFIKEIAPAAKEAAKTTGIPASFTIAQAALESGWGKHVPGFNLFGIKANSAWHGEVVVRKTREQDEEGKWYTVEAKFRKYSSWQESLEDHAHFLINNPRYSKAFKYKTGEDFAHAIAKAGYATDINYAQKICSIIRHHNLDELDVA